MTISFGSFLFQASISRVETAIPTKKIPPVMRRKRGSIIEGFKKAKNAFGCIYNADHSFDPKYFYEFFLIDLIKWYINLSAEINITLFSACNSRPIPFSK